VVSGFDLEKNLLSLADGQVAACTVEGFTA